VPYDYSSFDFSAFVGLEGVFIVNNIYSLNPKIYVSLISWDNGNTWQKIPAPTTFANGTFTNCNASNNCYLHLHNMVWAAEYDLPPPYSVTGAPGVMYAIGNIGQSLNLNTHAVLSTYFTRDGGYTWEELFEKPTIFEIVDSGNILAFADISEDTQTLYYSIDEGTTISSVPFTIDTNVGVDNVITSPSNAAPRALILALDTQTLEPVGLYAVDFSNLLTGQCEASDYYEWTPSYYNNNCILGRTVSYLRKLPTSVCLDAPNFVSNATITNCACTLADYECDFYYEPFSINSSLCVPSGGAPEIDCVGYYNASQGYHLINGDTCTGGLDLSPVLVECPPPGNNTNNSSSSSTSTSGKHKGTTGHTTSSGFLTSSTSGTPTTSDLSTTGSTNSSDIQGTSKKSKSSAIAAGVVVGVVGAACVSVAGFLVWRKRSNGQRYVSGGGI